MKITIEHHGDQFNVALSTAEGKEPYITVKGCRIVNGSDGPFVSWPARKQDSGKWWNHVYASRPFAEAVLRAAQQGQREEAPRRQAPRPSKPALDDDGLPPF
jgi:DNA-binding cell septation regulator SpoVG